MMSIIIPVKPPEPHLPELIKKIQGIFSEIEILVQTEPGLSYAIQKGVERAQGDVIAVIDGDGSHDPAYLPAMVQLLEEGHDLVLGSRYIEGGDPGLTPFRRVVSEVYTRLARVLLRLTVKDPITGMAVAPITLMRKLNHADTSYKYTLELLQHAHNPAEYPIIFKPRQAGKSKATPTQALQTLRLIAHLWTQQNPRLTRFIKFSAVALGFGYIANLALVLLFEKIGLWWGHGMLLAAAIIHTIKFTLNEAWTWKQKVGSPPQPEEIPHNHEPETNCPIHDTAEII